MAPEERGAIAALTRLRAEIADDRAALTRCVRDLDDATTRLSITRDDRAALALCAFAIHAWYTGLETICERIARQLDGTVPTGDRWHRELLTQLSVEVPGVRPAAIPRSTVTDLGSVLAFRHFFRHAYGVDLDPNRLDEEAQRVRRLRPTIDGSLDAFDEFLSRAVAAIAAR